MEAYPTNSPLVIDRAEGRELIDVDGRHYLDAISSLWVNTLGHRVPELDAALVAQVNKVAHSTMLGNGNTAVVELSEALAGWYPSIPPLPLRIRWGGRGRAGSQDRVPVLREPRLRRTTRFLALGDAYHGDTIGSLSLGDGGVFSAVFDPLCFPVVHARLCRPGLGR